MTANQQMLLAEAAAAGGGAAATPVFRAAGALSQAGSGSLSPALPASNAASDYDIILACNKSVIGAGTISTPSGWTLLANSQSADTQQQLSVFGRDMDGSESAPSITFGGSPQTVGARMFAFTGVNASTPTEGAATGRETGVTTPSLLTTTTTGANRLVLHASVNSGNVTGTPASGWTEREDDAVQTLQSMYLQEIAQASAGTTPSGTFTNSASSDVLKAILALLG